MNINTDSPILSSRPIVTAQPVARVFTPLRRAMKRLTRTASGFLLLLLAGCGEQEEGERCDLRNGSADCADGLTCRPLERLGHGREGAVCCPADNVSDLICIPATFDLGGDDDDDDDDESTAPAIQDAAASTSHDANSPLRDAASASDASNPTSDAASGTLGDAAPNQADAATDAASDAAPEVASDAAPDAADAAQ